MVWIFKDCKVLAGAIVISRLNWGWICLQAHSSGCSQDSVAPLVSCHVGSPQGSSLMAADIPLSEWEGKRETLSEKTSVIVFYSLILAVTSHNFCHVLFIRNKSLSPAHTQKEGITQEQSHSVSS